MELGYGDFRGNSGQVYLDQHYLARYPEQARWSQAQRLNFLHSQAVAVLRAHPSIYLRSCLMDLIVMLSHPGAYSWGQHPLSLNDIAEAASPTVAGPERWRGVLAIAIERPRAATEKVVSWIFLLALYLFAIWGVFRSGLRNACLWLLVGVAIYLLTVSVATTGAYPSPRLRIPVMPILCILASAGWQRTKTIAQ